MKAAVTELPAIELPVMLAGMGGVSHHPLIGAAPEAVGFGCPRELYPGQGVGNRRDVTLAGEIERLLRLSSDRS